MCEFRGELLDGRKVFKCIEDGVAYTVLRPEEYQEDDIGYTVSISCNRDGSDPMRFIMVPCPIWDDVPSSPVAKDDIRLLYQDPLDVFYRGTDINRFFGEGVVMPENPQWP